MNAHARTSSESTCTSRRAFVAGVAGATGLAAVSALGAQGALAQEAPSAANAPAGTDAASSATAPIEPVGVPDSWDHEADVIVVGLGGGGLNAAARCRQLGLSVVAIEKQATPGGNTQNATMFTIGGGTPQQDEAQFAVPSWPYDVNAWTDYMMTGFGQGADPELLHLIGENMARCFTWMGDTYGLDWIMGPNASYFYVQADGMSSLVEAASAYAKEQGAELLLSTEAQALVMDEGRVVGVKAIDADGSEVYLHGTKGVLLTGGGFASNKELLAQWCPSAIERCPSCYLMGIDTGECFRMGLGAGAAVVDKNSYTMFDGGMDWEAAGGEWSHYLFDGATQVVRQPWLTIRRDGSRVRYIDIMESMGALTDLAAAQTAGPEPRSYVLFDGNWDDYIKGIENYQQGFCQYECRMPVQDGMYKQADIPAYYQDYHAGFQDAVNAGVIKKADTLEELAEMLGLEAEVVTGAVERWNAMAETGHDDFVYPLKDAWLHPVVTPPFYGAQVGGFLFMTQTGLRINTKMQVISEQGTPIPGLYAGWHTAGGAAAPDYPGSMTFDTGGVSKSYLGGFLAAESVAGA